MLISHGIRAAAARTPGKIALQEDARQITFAALIERIDRVGHLAQSGLGLRHGERAVILAPNRIEYLEVVAGLSAVGVAVASIGPAASLPEIRFICEDSAARVLFVDAALEEAARAAIPASVEQVIVFGDQYEGLLQRAATSPCVAATTEQDIFSIPYTSGSTGRPKGVMLSHRGRILSAFCMAAEHGCYSPDDRAIATTPMFHGAGLLMALTPIFFGGSVRVLQRFDVEKLLHAIGDFGATSAYLVPTHFAALFAMSAEARGKFRVGTLKAVISGTAPLAQALKSEIIGYFGDGRLYERYGATETSIATCLRPADQLRKIACVGLPLPLTRVQVRGDDGRALPPGEVGELAVCSPYMFSGYLNMPEATAAGMRDGWFVTGDLARRDEEGYVYLVDRKNDMIISGGENVYPREVEEVLRAHPAVADCAVTGAPHPYWGEAIVAFVVPRPGTVPDVAVLLDLCRQHLSRYKVPKDIRLVESLPRNSMGKVLRRDLRDGLRAEAAATTT
ncbi:class I adenylate-forming enzyme family protein [Humitalea sp. 24SJ18S-53]|uniref:class I adenylate-forming enzyme family protein n=1 Tax=Humitalea sp. 24SJ18S-53 TaxID=3422307 RepID=UPI003D66464B